MTPHPFAALVYSVEDTLGLWQEVRKNEKKMKPNFDTHREHFQNKKPAKGDRDEYLPRLYEIFNRLHAGCNAPSEMINNHIDILECIYNSLARQTNIFEIFSENATQYYIATTLIPLMCSDIFIFKEKANKNSIYFHLNCLLENKELIIHQDEQRKANKQFLKKYIKGRISECFTHNSKPLEKTHNNKSDLLMPELIGYLNELPKSDNQTCKTLHEKINEYRERLSHNKIQLPLFDIEQVIAAYTAAIILLTFNKHTGLLSHLHDEYLSMSCGNNQLLCNLKSDYFIALSGNYDDKNFTSTNTLIYDHQYQCISTKLYLEINRKNNIDKITKDVVELWLLGYPSQILQQFEPFCSQELYLSKMVSLPPQFNSPMIFSDIDKYEKYKHEAMSINLIIFDEKITADISGLDNNESSLKSIYYSQYKPLIDALISIKSNHPSVALDIIKNSKINTTFGFIKHSLAVLDIGLLYKTKRNKIKHLTLIKQVNDIINHQGITFIPIATPEHVHNSWLSMDEYITNSLVKGKSTYNTIILQAIYAYNFTVARHTATQNIFSDSVRPEITRVNLLDVNYSSPLIIHDFLEHLNALSGKILSGLHKISLDVNHKAFAINLIRSKIITRRELTANLLHCIDGSSLGVCLLDHLTIIQFCSVPGDDVDNIVALGKNTKVVELLFRAYQYHSSGK